MLLELPGNTLRTATGTSPELAQQMGNKYFKAFPLRPTVWSEFTVILQLLLANNK